MANREITIDTDLVTRLIKTQFPEWANLTINPVQISGNDNRTFHLGDEIIVRLPSKRCYVPQIEQEHFWLPRYKDLVPQPIPIPLAKEAPAEDYPWVWSVYQCLEG